MGKLRKGEQSSSSLLFSGAATLGIAAIISKLIGTLQKIPLQNIAGDEAFGIYTAVYPFYTLLLFLATAGIPVAVSKMVSERVAIGAEAEVLSLFRIAQMLLIGLGLCFSFFMFFGAKQIALWIDNVHTYRALQAVSLALLFVPLMAAYRGFFQGLQVMVPTAVSQVVEQLIRVATMVILLIVMTKSSFSTDWIAAGATFGSVTGALAGLGMMVWYWRRSEYRQQTQRLTPLRMSRTRRRALLSQLLRISIPICLGAVAVPVLNIVDTFTVPRWLKSDMGSELVAMELFGVYSRGLPLVQLLAMLVSSVSVAIVPAFANNLIRQQKQLIRSQAEFILRLTWQIGLGASVGLAVCAVPINIMLYTNDYGSVVMAILAFSGIFSMINIVTASMLQGLGHAKASAINLLWAALLKLLLNAWWVPLYGIEGAAASAVCAFLLASMLNVVVLIRQTKIKLSSAHYVWRPLLALLAMGTALAAVLFGLGDVLGLMEGRRLGATVVALVAVACGAVVYLLALFWFKAITPKDLERFPSLGRKISPILNKIGWGK